MMLCVAGRSVRRLPIIVVDYNLLKPTVFGGAVPVLHSGGNLNHIALSDDDGGLSFFLIQANSANADDIHSTVNMPATSGIRGKGDDIRFWKVVGVVKRNQIFTQGKRIIDSAMRKADIFCFLNRVSVCCLL